MARIRRGSIVQRISAPGSIVARREARIGPEVRGTLQQIFVDEGELRWRPDDPLFQIDPEPYELNLRAAEAALDRVEAERRQLEADLSRGEALQQKRIIAEEQTQRIATGLEVALASEREAAEAVAMARRNLERTLVRAPFAGSITRRLADEGTTALVQPQTIVVILQETGVLEAVATIAETSLRRDPAGGCRACSSSMGSPCRSRPRWRPSAESVDLASRTFNVRMRVPDTKYNLKAGLFARVEILPRAKSEVLIAPRSALRSQDGQVHVLSIRDGRAVMSPIEVGLISEDSRSRFWPVCGSTRR